MGTCDVCTSGLPLKGFGTGAMDSSQRKFAGYSSWKRSASDLILDYLLQVDVDCIFGIPGGAIEPLFDALARLGKRNSNRDNSDFSYKLLKRQTNRCDKIEIKLVVARHETGAAFMADGYSRETGKLGVCCTTTGPGSTNLITGVASAYVDRIPLLIITPQTALPNFGKRSFQDSSGDAIDIVSMFDTCTRYNSFVSHIDQLEGKLFEAIYTAFRHPRGPVHLSIPMDILGQTLEIEKPLFHVATLLRDPQSYDELNFSALSNLLIQEKKKAVIFLGEGCLGDADVIVKFAELIDANIVATPMGKGCVSAYHPLYRGVFGFAGNESATYALVDEKVDVILAVGTPLGEFETSGWCDRVLLNKKLIHIDSAKENFSRSPMARLHVYGHLGSIFVNLRKKYQEKLNQENNVYSFEKGAGGLSVSVTPDKNVTKLVELRKNLLKEFDYFYDEKISNTSPVKPQLLMSQIAKKLPAETRFFVDVGNAWAWAIHYLQQKKSGTYHVGMGFGAMGWAIGAAIGAAIGSRRDPIVCITGDGSYLMSGQEITVAVTEKIPLIFVILNDQALGMIKHGQRLGGGEPIGFELPAVDFALMARAVGANGITIRTPKELLELNMEALCSREGPTLIDVYIDPEEVPPMGSRMKTLNRNADSK